MSVKETVLEAFRAYPTGINIHGTNLLNAEKIREQGLQTPWSIHISLENVEDPLDFLRSLKSDRIFGTAIGLAAFKSKQNSPNFEVDLTDKATTPAVVVFSPLKALQTTTYFSKHEENGFIPAGHILGTFPIPPFNPSIIGNYQVFKEVVRIMRRHPQ